MVIMSITVKDLFQYDPNFDNAKLQRLTGKKDYQKTDTINLSRLAGLNDKDLSIFAAKKEGSQGYLFQIVQRPFFCLFFLLVLPVLQNQ